MRKDDFLHPTVGCITTTGTATFSLGEEKKSVVSFDFDEELQRIVVVFRQKSNVMYTSYPGKKAPDKVWKEIYGICNGRIALLKVVNGIHNPEKFVPESIEFGDE